MAGFFKKLKKRLFDDKSDKGWLKDLDQGSESVVDTKPVTNGIEVETPAKERDPYFVQIGLDFGTSFTKVVCRDIVIGKPWVHLPTNPCNKELPFLISSAVCFDGKVISHPINVDGAYSSVALPHIKMALHSVGLSHFSDPNLAAYRTVLPSGRELAQFVEFSSVYLLAGILGEARESIRKRFPGEVAGDQVMVNLAVPVADANDARIESLFDRVLRRAWCLADELSGHPECSINELYELVSRVEHAAESDEVKEACFIYPEVSANVQGFIRSRASQPGLYLFSDTGAGTVDQSIFRFSRKDNGEEFLTYLSAQVLELGSSQVEKRALDISKQIGWEALEDFRKLKESGSKDRHVQTARRSIGKELGGRSKQTMAIAKRKLTLKQSIHDLRILFGGGGHTVNPYKTSIMEQFDTDIFRKDLIDLRRRTEPDFDRGMPDLKSDLNLKKSQERWSRRLSVAYGLSFLRDDLAPYKLPKDVSEATEDEIVKNRGFSFVAATKDDC